MLDRAADAEREIQFRRNGLAGTANLALHGEPAFVANRTRGRELRAHGPGQCFGLSYVFRDLDAAADGNDERRLGEVDGGFRFLEKFERLGADIAGIQIHRCVVNRGFAAWMRSKLIGAKRAGLERDEPGSGAGESDIGRGFALEHLTDEDELAAFATEAYAVANHAHAEHGGEL